MIFLAEFRPGLNRLTRVPGQFKFFPSHSSQFLPLFYMKPRPVYAPGRLVRLVWIL